MTNEHLAEAQIVCAPFPVLRGPVQLQLDCLARLENDDRRVENQVYQALHSLSVTRFRLMIPDPLELLAALAATCGRRFAASERMCDETGSQRAPRPGPGL